jgi:hypothetical protein
MGVNRLEHREYGDDQNSAESRYPADALPFEMAERFHGGQRGFTSTIRCKV